MSAVRLMLLAPQMVLYLFQVAVAASLACGAGLLAARACRRLSAPVRHGILVGTLLLVLLSPGAARLAQRTGWAWGEIAVANPAHSAAYPEPASLEPRHGSLIASPSAPGLRQASAAQQGTLPPTAGGTGTPLAPAATAAVAPVASQAANSGPGTICWWCVVGTALASTWIAGILVQAIRLAWGYRVLARFCRCLQEVAEPRVRALWQQATAAVGRREAPPIFRSPFAPAPLCLGIARPVIVVPDDILGELDDGQLQAILIHEAAHLARRDTWVSLAQRIAVVVFWWNALVYRLRDRIAELREEICDNYVCRAQRETTRFAQTLLDLAARATAQRSLPVALGALEPTGLLGRVTRLLNKERNMATRMSRASRLLVAAAAGGALLAIVLAGGPRLANSRASADDHIQRDQADDAVDARYMIQQASEVMVLRPAAILRRSELAPLARLFEQSDSVVFRGTRLNDFRQITAMVPQAAIPSGPREILVVQWVKPLAAQYLAQHAAGKDYTVSEFHGKKLHHIFGMGVALQEDGSTIVDARSEQAMEVYLAGKRGVPQWLPAQAWQSFQGDHFVIAADAAVLRREMKPLLQHSLPIVQAALLSISSLWEDATWLAAGARLNGTLTAHAWTSAKNADAAVNVQHTEEALRILAGTLVRNFRAPGEAGRESPPSLLAALSDEADRLLGAMKFERQGNNVQVQAAVELDKARLDALAKAIVTAVQPPDPSTKQGMMALVEDFFQHNYRDITSRQTLEWGPVAKTANGNCSIRYKYRCSYWWGEPKVVTQIFTFDAHGEFVSAEYAEKHPPATPARVYAIHKKVADFPVREDLTTPEAAYATINRAYAAEGNAAWPRLSVPTLAEHMPAALKKALPKQAAARLLDAEIIEVHVWDGAHAVVLALEEDPASGRSYVDMRWLDRVDGRWLNDSNDSRRTLDDARKKIEDSRSH